MGTVTSEQLERFFINLGKGRDSRRYLTVAGRIWWFRQEKPDWGIVTTPIEISVDKGFAVFSASIFNADGKLMTTATKCETRTGFQDFLEKAETGAVGRALAFLGYGTDAAGPELDEGDRYADAPQPAREPTGDPIRREPAPKPSPLMDAMNAFGVAARLAGFDVDVAVKGETKPSRSKFVDLAETLADWAEWPLVTGWQEKPDAWAKAADLVAAFAAAREEAGRVSG